MASLTNCLMSDGRSIVANPCNDIRLVHTRNTSVKACSMTAAAISTDISLILVSFG